MTIEYTYPEQRPTGATIEPSADGNTYRLEHAALSTIDLPPWVFIQDVPEICEAMMRLAGHEWPVKPIAIEKNAQRVFAERILARLEKAGYQTDSSWSRAIANIVREECGL